MKKEIPFIQDFQTVILANGAFPIHHIPLNILKNAERIVCCDGATESLLQFGLEPDYIVGDLDSLSDELKSAYSSILNHIPDQETNDLTKAVHFCMENDWKKITILGATGKREDHTLGNISLLANYADNIDVQMLTDYGTFISISESSSLESFSRQQISLFSISSETILSSENLRYPLKKMNLSSWWQGTLNEASGNSFVIEMNQGKVIIFREYE